MEIPDTVRRLLDAGTLAHCTTLNADGSPQVSAVWVGLDDSGGEVTVVMAHIPRNAKVRNLERDPRVVLSLQSEARNAMGLQCYVVLYGHARVTTGGAAELLGRLVKTYVGPDAQFPLPPNAPAGYVVHVIVDRIGGVGPWTSP